MPRPYGASGRWALALGLVVAVTTAPSPVVPIATEVRVGDAATVVHVVPPRGGAPRPLLLVLPPRLQRSHDAASVVTRFFAGAGDEGWWAASPAAREQLFHAGAEHDVAAIAEALRQRYPTSAVHLAGESTGAMGAVRAALLDPTRYASLTLLAGAPSAADLGRLDQLGGLPTLVVYGSLDPGRDRIEDGVDRLRAASVPVRTRIVEGAGHELPSWVGPWVLRQLESGP